MAARDLYGLVLCGGNSSRMGDDKSLLVYYDKPQCYQLYEMLKPFCEKVFISCNNSQLNKIQDDYSTLADLPGYSNCGPMGALLTAFHKYPGKDLLVIGCDYPFLTAMDIRSFISSFKRTEMAAAFYNDAAGLYEPMLAYYNSHSAEPLLHMHANSKYSLQFFLKENNAAKFYPGNLQSIQSIDTKEDYIKTIKLTGKRV